MITKGEGAVLGGNVGHPIVTNGILCMMGGDMVLPKLFWDFLLLYSAKELSKINFVHLEWEKRFASKYHHNIRLKSLWILSC